MEATVHRVAKASRAEDPGRETDLYRLSRQLLGGTRFIKQRTSSRSEVHAAILQGIPFESLNFMLTGLKTLDESDVVNVLGISTRTLRRQRDTPGKSMPTDLASKTWLLAEMLAKATDVFGDRDRAEAWMGQPAMGLDGQRPIDLLQTLQGTEIVGDFLTRLEYAVYT